MEGGRKRLIYARQVRRWATANSSGSTLRPNRNKTQTDQLITEPTSSSPCAKKMAKAYVRKVGGRRDHVVFILIASEMQHGVADYGELTAQLPDETFATGKPPASSRLR